MAEANVKGFFLPDRPVSLTWHDGDVTGDGDALYYLEAVMEQNPTVAMTPTGPFFKAADAKTDGWAFIATALSFLAAGRYTQQGLPVEPPITDPSVVS